ncbi:hypothetical protein QJS04_geneDACA021793 [Acorus gramineus]|uniref:Alpha-mannosidase n=1 Tax=Acorus gramineus TaxID=55184 RepID=A0AAV9A4Y8_ACOGR|nr:hypothetical protein QJS04_geneDACA021793 [Acorus gramineus]
MAIGASSPHHHLLLLLPLVVSFFAVAEAKYIAYNTSQGIVPGKLNVHLVAHTHDDVGWLKTVDQYYVGSNNSIQEFGQVPRIGWQIDPFGHSAVQAYLLSAEVGFDALYFARIDYQDRAKRKDDKTLEIFTGMFPNGNYEPPKAFYFEVNDVSSINVQDDPLLFDYNVQERVDDFVAAAVAQANVTRTNHIMWTMGTDFKYQYAESWFKQMDKLIHYVNQDGRVNALYSTPSIYTDAKYAAKESWPLKTDDFFPYADRADAYWTGYFTSRPAFKRYVRDLSGYYLAARQLEFFKGRNASGPTTDALGDALGLAQHHDAVSGTEKQHVANDYAKRLSIGYKECPLLNISYCPPSEVNLSQGKSLVVVVYNSLGWEREDVIQIPVLDKSVIVRDNKGREIQSQLLPLVNASVSLRDFYVRAYLGISPGATPKFWLAFAVSVPPLGFSTYFISNSEQTASSSAMSTEYKIQGDEDSIEIGSGNLKLIYSAKEAKLTHYSNSKSLVKESVEQSYSFYSGDDGSGSDPQASGAYVFRPNGSFPIKPDSQVPLTVLRGPLLDEVHQRINPWIYQITRVYKEKEHAEFEFIVGPIPVDDNIGKEVVTQITTTMMTNKTFYTDSNGRDFLKRINLGIYMEGNRTELSVLVDRAVGGGSILDGQVELMLHRRLLHDDSRGVAEALDEIDCIPDQCSGLTIQGKYYLRIDPLGEGAKWRRSVGQEIYSPLRLAFSEQDGGNWKASHLSTYSAIDPSYSLPDNVAIITLQELEHGSVLLRLAHLYEVEEDKDLSVMATVDLRKLFPEKKGFPSFTNNIPHLYLHFEGGQHNDAFCFFLGFQISKVTETNLAANQGRDEMQKKRLVWKVEGPSNDETMTRGGPVDPSKLLVELGPMEIRTFIVNFDYIFFRQLANP